MPKIRAPYPATFRQQIIAQLMGSDPIYFLSVFQYQ